MVLLKNEGRALPFSLLPRDDDDDDDDDMAETLDKEDSGVMAVERRLRRGRRSRSRRGGGRGRGSVAVVGPHGNATEALLGNYFGVPPFIVTPLAGIQQYVYTCL
jgi:hypothetical protein